MNAKTYLKTFFEEKQLPFQHWEMNDKEGTLHFIDNEVVIEALLNEATDKEQDQAANIIRRIDFANGDVNHFLKHLAQGLVNTHAAGYELA